MRSSSLVVLFLFTTLKYASAAPQVQADVTTQAAPVQAEASLEANFNVNLASTGQIVTMNDLGFGACSGLQGASNAGINVDESLRNFNSTVPAATSISVVELPASSTVIDASFASMTAAPGTMSAEPSASMTANPMSSTIDAQAPISTVEAGMPPSSATAALPSGSAEASMPSGPVTVTVTVDSCQAPSTIAPVPISTDSASISIQTSTASAPVQSDLTSMPSAESNNTMPIFTMDDMMPSSTIYTIQSSTLVMDSASSSTVMPMPSATEVSSMPVESGVAAPTEDAPMPAMSATASASDSMTAAVPVSTDDPSAAPSGSMSILPVVEPIMTSSSDALAAPPGVANSPNADINPGGSTSSPTVGVTPMTNTDTLSGFLDTVVLKINGEVVCKGNKNAVITEKGYKCDCVKEGHSLYMVKNEYFRLKRKANFKTFCKNKYTFIYHDGVKDHKITLQGPKQKWKQSRKCNVKFAKKFTCHK